MSKTIEEKAKDFLKSRNHQRGSVLITINEALNGLVDFANEINKWTPVTEKFPIQVGDFSKDVQIKLENNLVLTGYIFCDEKSNEWYFYDDYKIGHLCVVNVTHWRYFFY